MVGEWCQKWHYINASCGINVLHNLHVHRGGLALFSRVALWLWKGRRAWPGLKWVAIFKIIRGPEWRSPPSHPGQSAPACAISAIATCDVRAWDWASPLWPDRVYARSFLILFDLFAAHYLYLSQTASFGSAKIFSPGYSAPLNKLCFRLGYMVRLYAAVRIYMKSYTSADQVAVIEEVAFITKSTAMLTMKDFIIEPKSNFQVWQTSVLLIGYRWITMCKFVAFISEIAHRVRPRLNVALLMRWT